MLKGRTQAIVAKANCLGNGLFFVFVELLIICIKQKKIGNQDQGLPESGSRIAGLSAFIRVILEIAKYWPFLMSGKNVFSYLTIGGLGVWIFQIISIESLLE